MKQLLILLVVVVCFFGCLPFATPFYRWAHWDYVGLKSLYKVPQVLRSRDLSQVYLSGDLAPNYPALQKWFSNSRMTRSPQRLRDNSDPWPHTLVSESGAAWELESLTSSQGMLLMLLIQGPHFENPYHTTSYFIESNVSTNFGNFEWKSLSLELTTDKRSCIDRW